jgi:hypothetical protein
MLSITAYIARGGDAESGERADAVDCIIDKEFCRRIREGERPFVPNLQE